MKCLSIGLIVLGFLGLGVYNSDLFLLASPFVGGAVGYILTTIVDDKIEKD